MDGMGGMDMTMQMYYYCSTSVTILFESWDTQGNQFYYALSLIALFTLAILSEGWSAFSSYLRSRRPPTVSEPRSVLARIVGNGQENAHHLVNACCYTLKLVLGYQLMLAVMTYNVGVSIAIFFGAFVGHFLFARFVAYDQSPSSEEIPCHL